MKKSSVHQFHSGTAVGDAVTSSMLYMRDILALFGIESDIYAEHVDERISDQIKSVANFDPDPEDLLIVHHSMGHELMPLIRALPCRKVLQYHNITPPLFFGPESQLRHYARVGLAMLSDYREIVEGAFADSDYNAAELVKRGYANVEVIPLLRDFGDLRWRKHDPRPYYFDEPRYQLLFVGRISPNKGQLHLIRFMSAYGDAFQHPLHLTLVGHSGHGEDYAERVMRDIETRGLQDRIEIAGHVSDETLYGLYRAADAYVSYSEHEGFGVPLLEAMAFDTPVVAYDTSAIGSTLGNGGLRLKTTDPSELAGVLRDLFENPDRRRALIRAQRERLTDFSRPVVAQKFLKFLEPHLPRGLVPMRPQNDAPVPAVERTYMIEGPCETSYSLAIVNRNLALGLDARENTQARLTPAEGVPQYNFQPEGLVKYPQIAPLLKAPPLDARATEISIRNMYPLRPAGMIGDYRLANYFWEESEIPLSMARLLNRYLDGLIAPTQFCRRAFRNSGVRIPVEVAGCGVDNLAIGERSNRDRKNTRFTFGHVSSGMARKGVEELFAAYATAFRADDAVDLIVKTHRNVSNIIEELYNRIIANRPNAPSVKIIYDDLDDAEMDRFYDLIDVLALPTRGEGYNLPAAEAMARGVPVLVTAYSGQMDFCTHQNAYLIDYHFERSGSHLNTSGAMWVRADLADLATKMRALFENHGDPTMLNKVEAARKTGAGLTWAASAEKVDAFADNLAQPRKQQEKMKLGWVSTWNTECGIANYSQFLIDHLPERLFDLTIFGNHEHTVGQDGPNVQRLWTNRSEPLDRVVAATLEQKLDAIVFQYNYGFHRLVDLAKAVVQLEDAGISVYVFFHKTKEVVIEGVTETIADAAPALRQATRLVVHSVEDVERLRSFGLVDNAVKLSHGAFRPKDIDPTTMRSMLGLSAFRPIIATYGFLLPEKGLPETILAFSSLLGKYPEAVLLMVNSLYGKNSVSKGELERCRGLIADLNLADKVILIPEFLDDRDSINLLQAADVIVFSYQNTGESSSAAVRHGLSAIRPVVTTPLPIFTNVSYVTHQARGVRPIDIADAISEVLECEELRTGLVARQRTWLDAHDWRGVGERFANMVIGLFEDRRGVRVVPGGDDAEAHTPVREPAPETAEWYKDMQPEAFARIAYQRALGRGPSPQEVADIVFELRANAATRGDIFNRLSRGRQSARYKDVPFAELQEKSEEDFVHALYEQLLERQPDEAGALPFINALKAQSMSRAEIVRMFLNSDEFLAKNRPIRVTSLPEA